MTPRPTSSISSKSTPASRSSTASPKKSTASTSSSGWCCRRRASCRRSTRRASSRAGASIQVRLYAEDPGRDFRPSAGLLTHVAWPEDARVETWVAERIRGLAVLRSDAGQDHRHGRDARRGAEQAADRARRDRDRRHRDQSRLSPAIVAPRRARERRDAHAHAAEFRLPGRHHRGARAGTQTTIQDWPGGVGYWAVGVPPSGPMDALSFRLANRLVGNDEGAAGIETHARRARR